MFKTVAPRPHKTALRVGVAALTSAPLALGEGSAPGQSRGENCPGCRKYPRPLCACCGAPTQVVSVASSDHTVSWCPRCWALLESVRNTPWALRPELLVWWRLAAPTTHFQPTTTTTGPTQDLTRPGRPRRQDKTPDKRQQEKRGA
jgi:hypothetical protein